MRYLHDDDKYVQKSVSDLLDQTVDLHLNWAKLDTEHQKDTLHNVSGPRAPKGWHSIFARATDLSVSELVFLSISDVA